MEAYITNKVFHFFAFHLVCNGFMTAFGKEYNNGCVLLLIVSYHSCIKRLFCSKFSSKVTLLAIRDPFALFSV